VSRIGTFGIDDAAPAPRAPAGPILRRNRKRPLHPETIADLLRERAAQVVTRRGPTPYGWLIILYADSGRVVRHTAVDATYEDACKIYETEQSWAGMCGGWIVAKRTPHQSTVLP